MKTRLSFWCGALFCLGLLGGSAVQAEQPRGAAAAGVRIVNGHPAEGNFPWMAELFYADATPAEGLRCGAALIHPQYVITAAHCVADFESDPTSLKVAIGKTRLTQNSGYVRDVAGIIVYPSYNSDTAENDVALVKLSAPVPGPVLPLVAQSESALWAPGAPATILGWGTMDPHFPAFPDLLQQASIPVVSDDSCEQVYGLAFHHDSMVCAGKVASTPTSDDGVDTCSGDSGGPLLVKDAGGNWKLAGLTSWGFSCATHRYPGVYTRVAQFALWVYTFPAVPPFPLPGSLQIQGNPQVGETLTCDAGNFGGDRPVTFEYGWVADGTLVSGANAAQYKLRPEDENTYVACKVIATNSGGSREFYSDEVGPIAPAPTPPTTTVVADTTAPKIAKHTAHCADKSCTVSVDVNEDTGPDNVSRVEAFAIKSFKAQCTVVKNGKKKKVACTKTAAEFFGAGRSGDSTWSFDIPRTKTEYRYQLFVKAYDKSGNVDPTGTGISMKVPKLKKSN